MEVSRGECEHAAGRVGRLEAASEQDLVFFFFQAEDGIRDWSVTGVQTCALPISASPSGTHGTNRFPLLSGVRRVDSSRRSTTGTAPETSTISRSAGELRQFRFRLQQKDE